MCFQSFGPHHLTFVFISSEVCKQPAWKLRVSWNHAELHFIPALVHYFCMLTALKPTLALYHQPD